MAHAVAPTTTRVADAAALASLHSVCGCLRFLWWMSRTGPRTMVFVIVAVEALELMRVYTNVGHQDLVEAHPGKLGPNLA